MEVRIGASTGSLVSRRVIFNSRAANAAILAVRPFVDFFQGLPLKRFMALPIHYEFVEGTWSPTRLEAGWPVYTEADWIHKLLFPADPMDALVWTREQTVADGAELICNTIDEAADQRGLLEISRRVWPDGPISAWQVLAFAEERMKLTSKKCLVYDTWHGVEARLTSEYFLRESGRFTRLIHWQPRRDDPTSFLLTLRGSMTDDLRRIITLLEAGADPNVCIELPWPNLLGKLPYVRASQDRLLGALLEFIGQTRQLIARG